MGDVSVGPVGPRSAYPLKKGVPHQPMEPGKIYAQPIGPTVTRPISPIPKGAAPPGLAKPLPGKGNAVGRGRRLIKTNPPQGVVRPPKPKVTPPKKAAPPPSKPTPPGSNPMSSAGMMHRPKTQPVAASRLDQMKKDAQRAATHKQTNIEKLGKSLKPGSLHKPDKGDPRVRALQTKLNAKGYHLIMDGIMGPKTRKALRSSNKMNKKDYSGVAKRALAATT